MKVCKNDEKIARKRGEKGGIFPPLSASFYTDEKNSDFFLKKMIVGILESNSFNFVKLVKTTKCLEFF